MARNSVSISKALLFCAIILGVSGCKVELHSLDSLKSLNSMDSLRSLNSTLNQWLDRLLHWGSTPETAPSGEEQSLKDKAGLLHEVFKVVLLREPVSMNEFSSYLEPMSQGASIEGIYNGFVNSEHYHHLEKDSPPASPKTVEVFVDELQVLEKELPKPTDFDIPTPVDQAKYDQHFQTSSIYTLKRILGNEALKVLEAKEHEQGASPQKAREDLARWYASWAVGMDRWHVDFGLPLRNKPDYEFHRTWALNAPQDILTWEVLNRLHRLLNATEENATRVITFPGKSGKAR